MKLSSLTLAINGIAITLSISLVAYIAYHDPVHDLKAGASYINDLDLLKIELSKLNNVNNEINELKQKIRQIESKSLQKLQPIQTQTVTENNDSKSSLLEDLPEDPAELSRLIEESNQKSLDRMNSAFLAETSDPEWAGETANLITRFFESEEGAKLNVSEVQCRKTSCKVDISKVDKMHGGNSLMLHFPIYVGQNLPKNRFFHARNDDDTSNVTIFLARDGFDLPEERAEVTNQ